MPSNSDRMSDPQPAARLPVSRAIATAFLLGTYGVAFVLAMTSSRAHASAGSLFLVVSAILGLALIALSVIDAEQLRLPDAITLSLITGGLLHTYIVDVAVIVLHAAAAAVGYTVLSVTDLLYRRLKGISGIGLGDAKLFAASGSWLGLAALPSVLMLAALLGLALALAIYASGARISARTRLPFGPCLALALWIVWLWGPVESWT